MPVAQPNTVVIHAYGMVAAKSSNVVVQLLSKKLDFSKVRTIQFIPGGRIRVTFSSQEYRNTILEQKTLCIDGVHILNITASDSPITNVYVHYLPDEAGDVGIRLAFLPFGTVHEITYQHFAGFKNIKTGTRIVRMSLDQHIPFQCNINGYHCRVWYVGQPLKCTICQGAHKAADCPDRNKCKRCHQAGHFARDCKNAWNTFPGTSGGHAPPPSSSDPPPPLSSSDPPPLSTDPPSQSTDPPPPAGSVPSDPRGSGAESDSLVPLMSVDVVPPVGTSDIELLESSDCTPQGEFVSSQVSLFSSSEDPIGQFSEEASQSLSPSPSISSFTSPSGNCSESILKDITIVSSGPELAEQIIVKDKSIVSSSPKVAEQIVSNDNVDNCSVSNVGGNDPKVVKKNNNGHEVAGNNAKVSSGPKVANKSNVPSGIPVAYAKVKAGSKLVSHHSGPKVGTVSSDSEPEFKKPKVVPSGVRSRSRSPMTSSGVHKSLPCVADSRPSRPR